MPESSPRQSLLGRRSHDAFCVLPITHAGECSGIRGVAETGLFRRRPRALDLFCGAGGVSEGLDRAGFDVVGVDVANQPRYPFAFIRADALSIFEVPWFNVATFDFIWASPPCQRYSDLAGRNGNADEHPDLIAPMRGLLKGTGLPYIIENVEGAPLRDPMLVCGTALGLGVDGYRLRRHRLFESNVPLAAPACACAGDARPVIDVSGGGPSLAPRLEGAGGRTYKGTARQAALAMGIGWMTKNELNEAIPPTYAYLLATQISTWSAGLVPGACGDSSRSYG